MSDAISALNGATYEGFCTVSDAGLTGMVTLRGDLAGKSFAAAVKKVTGCAVPGQGAVTEGKGRRLAWMSPDELLLFCGYEEAPGLANDLAEALKDEHALAANVSDARAVFRVAGAGCRDVMAKLTPANVAPDAFGPGQMRRTRLAQVPGAFHMPDAATFEIVVFRSVAQYAWDLLVNAAQPGSEVGLFAG